MNILFLVHNHKNRGSYFRALEIARQFAARGHYVQFAFTSEVLLYRPAYTPVKLDEAGNVPESDGHPVTRELPALGSGNFTWAEMPCFTMLNARQEGWSFFDNFWRIRDGLSRKWDYVYGFSHKPNCVLPALAAKLRGAKIILDWADWWGGPEGLYRKCVIPSQGFQAMPRPTQLLRRVVFQLEEWWEGRVYHLADYVTLISEEYYHHPGAPRNLKAKSIVMHSGAPLDQIKPVTKSTARDAFGLKLPDDAVVLGYVANFHMDEELLIEAFAQVCRQRDNVYLLLAGAPLEATTPEQHAATSGRIIHVGWQPFARMQEFLGAADILLLPLTDIALDRARYPHKLSDYVAAGRPIIACDVGETGRLQRRFEFGKLAPPTATGFASTILEIIETPDAWPTIGSQTRQIADKHFNWNTMIEKLLKLIRV